MPDVTWTQSAWFTRLVDIPGKIAAIVLIALFARWLAHRFINQLGRRAEKGDTAAVNAGYLNAIVSDLLKPCAPPHARGSPVAKADQLRAHNSASFAAAKAAILAREQQHAVE